MMSGRSPKNSKKTGVGGPTSVTTLRTVLFPARWRRLGESQPDRGASAGGRARGLQGHRVACASARAALG